MHLLLYHHRQHHNDVHCHLHQRQHLVIRIIAIRFSILETSTMRRGVNPESGSAHLISGMEVMGQPELEGRQKLEQLAGSSMTSPVCSLRKRFSSLSVVEFLPSPKEDSVNSHTLKPKAHMPKPFPEPPRPETLKSPL